MGFSMRMCMSFSMGMGMSFIVNMSVTCFMNVSCSMSMSFANDMSLLDDFSDNRLGMSCLNDGLFIDLISDFSPFLVAALDVRLMHNRNMRLLN